jgi:23S rRNA pseudouridine1911/1915/1917 synthase
MLDKKTETLIIPDSLRELRLDQALAQILPDYSRSQIQQWIESGGVLVNHLACKAKMKVKGGEVVTIEVTFKSHAPALAQNIPLSILFEDESILIINKPVGMVVHPGAGNADQTLFNALLHYSSQLQFLPRAGILHRLDKNTSGLLVVAKTSTAFKKLSHQLKNRTIKREYQAIVQGSFISGGLINAPIGRHPIHRKRMTVTDTGKPSQTHYRIIEKFRAHTLMRIRLETGRTHQIRVHFSHIHHPVVGDPVYGGRIQLAKGMSAQLITAIREFKRQALHACALGLHHPETDELIEWQIDLPDDMQQLIQILRDDIP